MSDRTLYEIVDDTLMGRTAVPPTNEGDIGYEYPTARPMLNDLVRSGVLVKAEPTDRICLYHNARTAVDRNRCVLSYNDLGNETPACEMVDVVRMET